jgi:hypothetical protein
LSQTRGLRITFQFPKVEQFMQKKLVDARKGRPPKFEGPRKPITVTLPERTLRQLDTIGPDRARAIVRVVEQVAGDNVQRPDLVEKVAIGQGAAIILVPENRPLRSIPWLRLVRVAPNRFLMAVTSGTTIEEFELQIQDLISELAPGDQGERELLEELLHVVSGSRKRRVKAEILFVPSDTGPTRRVTS